MKPSSRPGTLLSRIPLGPERRRALDLVADRWSMWILLAIDEHEGARFGELAPEPGLSRRVLTERLQRLIDGGLVTTRLYQVRPPRRTYLLSERGLQARRLALALVHVAAGGALHEDPLRTAQERVSARFEGAQHPADALLASDLQAAARIHAATVLPLSTYDERYGTRLVETLRTWLACDASVSMAAAQLHAHRHTIRYRLDRVRELTGLDVAVSEDREQLALGLRALRVLGAADAPAPER